MDLKERRQLPLFPIGTVQKLTGLTARQIRYYEQNQLVSPARSEGKQRLFSFLDVERLMLIRQWLDEGNNIAGVKRNFESLEKRGAAGKSEMSDEEVYKWLQKELMEGPSSRSQSMFIGDLSRFYRKK